MNDEIKEVLHLLKRCDNTYLKIENSNGEKEYEYHQVNDLRLDGYHSQLLLDYITNLQEKNEKYKKIFEGKERFSKIMPEDIDFIILSKSDYDRQEKDIQLELIDYKSRINKAIEYIKDFENKFKGYAVFPDKRFLDLEELLNILNGGDEE